VTEPVTSRRLAAVIAAHARWVNTWAPAIGPHRGPCGLCGFPDARHRVADAMVEAYLAGDPLASIAHEHDVTFRELAEVVAAGLAYDIARRRARLPRSHVPEPP
jgi:hypothetical protein